MCPIMMSVGAITKTETFTVIPDNNSSEENSSSEIHALNFKTKPTWLSLAQLSSNLFF